MSLVKQIEQQQNSTTANSSDYTVQQQKIEELQNELEQIHKQKPVIPTHHNENESSLIEQIKEKDYEIDSLNTKLDSYTKLVNRIENEEHQYKNNIE